MKRISIISALKNGLIEKNGCFKGMMRRGSGAVRCANARIAAADGSGNGFGRHRGNSETPFGHCL